ncbi:MAG: EFR1 family ferrodoxin [Symbiobacteriaceae bacterium]|nr:EFR1 family ferrodoxin [Symbiobacteriaceae bacterium]
MRIFCFSGSGNSYAVAASIGSRFSVKPELVTRFKDIDRVDVSDSQIGIIAPVYLNDVPCIVKEFLLKLCFADTNAYVFAVLTSGSGKNKTGFQSINLALAQNMGRLALAFDISMPSSYQARADMDSKLSAVPQMIEKIVQEIEDGHENYKRNGSTSLPRDFTRVSFLQKLLTHMKVTEKCNGCGLCLELCPKDNISLRNGRAFHGSNCIACTACVNWCPSNATTYRFLKGQYRHPDISATDLIITKNEE